MRILELEKHFKSEETLNKVLEAVKEDFDNVDYYADTVMKHNLTSNPEEAKKALNVLTGIFSNLRTVLAIAETEKRNREIAQYNKIRIQAGKEDKKFVSASADKQASAYVGSYRRVRNIIEAYKESCQVMVSSLQSLLKYMITETHLEQN